MLALTHDRVLPVNQTLKIKKAPESHGCVSGAFLFFKMRLAACAVGSAIQSFVANMAGGQAAGSTSNHLLTGYKTVDFKILKFHLLSHEDILFSVFDKSLRSHPRTCLNEVTHFILKDACQTQNADSLLGRTSL